MDRLWFRGESAHRGTSSALISPQIDHKRTTSQPSAFCESGLLLLVPVLCLPCGRPAPILVTHGNPAKLMPPPLPRGIRYAGRRPPGDEGVSRRWPATREVLSIIIGEQPRRGAAMMRRSTPATHAGTPERMMLHTAAARAPRRPRRAEFEERITTRAREERERPGRVLGHLHTVEDSYGHTYSNYNTAFSWRHKDD